MDLSCIFFFKNFYKMSDRKIRHEHQFSNVYILIDIFPVCASSDNDLKIFLILGKKILSNVKSEVFMAM